MAMADLLIRGMAMRVLAFLLPAIPVMAIQDLVHSVLAMPDMVTLDLAILLLSTSLPPLKLLANPANPAPPPRQSLASPRQPSLLSEELTQLPAVIWPTLLVSCMSREDSVETMDAIHKGTKPPPSGAFTDSRCFFDNFAHRVQ